MGIGTQGVAPGSGLVGLSARAGPQTGLFTHNPHPFDISIFPLPHNAKGATHRAVYGSFCFDFSKEVYNRVNYISIKEVQRIT